MAITQTVDVIATALWPQGDIRDPLGIWGFRLGVTGDASGGSIKVTIRSSSGQDGAFVYTCYSAIVAVLTAAILGGQQAKIRLLTNWPNIDPQAGVQAYGSVFLVNIGNIDPDMTSPVSGPTLQQMVGPLDRFLLLFDPRPSAGQIDIMEIEYGSNELAATYSFEGYGYYWDRSVLNAPGGPRHPGAS